MDYIVALEHVFEVGGGGEEVHAEGWEGEGDFGGAADLPHEVVFGVV